MRVGIIGTGYAAQKRAEALHQDPRVTLVAVAGHTPEKTDRLALEFGIKPMPDWVSLLQLPQIELVVICTVNRDHAQIVQAALEQGKHVVVEYPLAMDPTTAHSLMELARRNQILLHVEHIELLSGVHLMLQREMPKLGSLFSISYVTLNACRPAPDRWTYSPDLFGFPLMGAVSRIHRLVDLLGPVQQVSCQLRYDGPELPLRYRSCYCTAQLQFASGVPGILIYGKGEAIWRSQRNLEFHGQQGALIVEDDEAVLIQPEQAHALKTGSRRGLFAQDTRMVLDHLYSQTPLYGNPQSMLHSLAVAQAAAQAAATQQIISVPRLPESMPS